ncbi:7-cyano-7-deazaguanine synthase [Haladaptatus pallidirubidus]|nr:7-cyano-7-deazaguanine synthase [Haladaptatus pallidirubidus]
MSRTVQSCEYPTNFAQPALIDPQTTVRERLTFIKQVIADTDVDGVVVTLSGDVDSTVAATLAVKALNPESVYGLVLSTGSNLDGNLSATHHVAADLDITHRTLDITPFVEALTQTIFTEVRRFASSETLSNLCPQRERVQTSDNCENSTVFRGTVARRVGKLAAFVEAKATSRLALGAENRTTMLRDSTIFARGRSVDLLPFGDLYRTEVRDIAQYLDVPTKRNESTTSNIPWFTQVGESDCRITTETIDMILWKLVDNGAGIEQTAETLGVEPTFVGHVAVRYARRVQHHETPPIPKRDSPPVGGI